MHCTDAVCVDVCPTNALKYGPHGIITFEEDLCNGCGYCSQFCPFQVPQMEVANRFTGEAKSSKCVFCQDRTMNGLTPACVKTCPAGALDWGERDAMVGKADARVNKLKTDMGFPQAMVYGKAELGGLGRIYVLTAPPEAYGLPKDPRYPATSTLWQKVLQPLGGIAVGAAALGAFVVFLISRQHVEMEEVE
jgi:formate dehydrogenase iron-sulfur subunit